MFYINSFYFPENFLHNLEDETKFISHIEEKIKTLNSLKPQNHKKINSNYAEGFFSDIISLFSLTRETTHGSNLCKGN